MTIEITVQDLLNLKKKISETTSSKQKRLKTNNLIQHISDTFKSEIKELKSFYSNQQRLNSIIMEALDHINTKDDVKKAKREYFAGLVKVLALTIKHNPSDNKYFITDFLASKERWTPLRKIVIAARIQQLKNAKVVRKKGRYDLSEVTATLYGKTIFESLNYKGRYVLKKEEYEIFKTKAKEMGFELPEEIEPTTAELYFD